MHMRYPFEVEFGGLHLLPSRSASSLPRVGTGGQRVLASGAGIRGGVVLERRNGPFSPLLFVTPTKSPSLRIGRLRGGAGLGGPFGINGVAAETGVTPSEATGAKVLVKPGWLQGALACCKACRLGGVAYCALAWEAGGCWRLELACAVLADLHPPCPN